MPRPARFTAAHVRQVVEQALATWPEVVEHIPAGWGNENWRVESPAGRFVVKFGPPDAAAKWAATRDVYHLGGAARLPIPQLVHFNPASELAGGWVVRVLTWMEGLPPETVLDKPPMAERFFSSLGAALRGLHSLPANEFSSRLDGSAPAFDRWSDYVGWRLPQVLERVRATHAFPDSDTQRVVRAIEELAGEVSPVVRPSICHRDLYLDNMLSTSDGHLAALLDFDGAEAWDPAIDVVKLRWLAFPDYPDAETCFLATYGSRPKWADRILLAELLELLNVVPNAIVAGDSAFEASARRRLRQVFAA